jgi:Mn2+/Fe2+ NRAMP family transporter
VSRTFSEAPLFLGLFTAQVAIGAGIALAPGNLVQLLVNMQFLNGLITPIMLTFVLILANRRTVLGNAVNGPRFRVVASISVAVIATMAILVLLQTVAGWLHLTT